MKLTSLETVRADSHPNLLMTRLRSDQGLTGLGETFYGSRAVEAYLHETAADRLLGQDVASFTDLAQRLPGYVGRGASGVETRGMSAVDVALWDLQGKLERTPIWQMINPDAVSSIRTYNTCAGPDYVQSFSHQETTNWGLPEQSPSQNFEDLRATFEDPGGLARSLLDHGIDAMKIWPFDRAAERTDGRDISRDDLADALQPLVTIRDAVGSSIDIRVELHGLWMRPAAEKIFSALEPLDVAWVEDPVPTLDVWEGSKLAASAPIAIAAGETLAGEAAYRHLCERRAVDIVVCDVGWCGGISAALNVADLASEHGLEFTLHDCTGPIGLAVATHLACALPHVSVQEFTRAFYYGWYPEFVSNLVQFHEGRLYRSEAPGHGLELQEGLTDRPDVHVKTRTARK